MDIISMTVDEKEALFKAMNARDKAAEVLLPLNKAGIISAIGVIIDEWCYNNKYDSADFLAELTQASEMVRLELGDIGDTDD